MIIAHSPTIHESGSVPYRIVLRQLDSEYVVHTECITPEGSSYYCGHYFRFTNESSKATMLLKAWDRFAERARASL